jgi:DNA polymerase-3 subunit chi
MSQAACEVWFYHLERASLEGVLRDLLEKTLSRGWRALVRTIDADRLAHLDAWLWTYRDESFLPHGVAGEAASDRQPILLTAGEDNLNAAQVLFVLDEPPPDISAYDRCILIFDGADEAAVARARALWSTWKAADLSVAYWKQGETRGWEKQA